MASVSNFVKSTVSSLSSSSGMVFTCVNASSVFNVLLLGIHLTKFSSFFLLFTAKQYNMMNFYETEKMYIEPPQA